jgi:hypothetical protein
MPNKYDPILGEYRQKDGIEGTDVPSYETDPLSLHLDQTTPQTITATDVTITATDEIYYGDVTDSTKIKKDTVQGILDLVPAGITAHSDLTELDYASAGHTGFATAAQGALADTALQAEADTLATVTGRGASTTQSVLIGASGTASDTLDVHSNSTNKGITVDNTPDEVYGTGGDTIGNYTDGATTYRYHKFTTLGAATFVAPSPARNVEVLVIGGGGGGGSCFNTPGGGGGGAGGYQTNSSYSLTGGQSVSVTVGDGGLGGQSLAGALGSSGQDSVFGTITAIGGGGGAGWTGGSTNGRNGGSGGGGVLNGSVGTGSQGSNGGSPDNTNQAGGGGGGAFAVGSNASGGNGGNGGAGIANTITGSSVSYAGGGGGGGGYTTGRSGGTATHGGGNGGGLPNGFQGVAGTPNTGGGGGGSGGASTPNTKGGNGGSGIVVVRYITTGQNSQPEIKLKSVGTQTAKIWTDGSASDTFKIDVASTTRVAINPTTGRVSIDALNAVSYEDDAVFCDGELVFA